MSPRFAIIALLAACAPAWQGTPHDQLFQTERRVGLVRAPAKSDPSDWWDKATRLVVRPLGQLVSPGTYVKGLFGGPPARDVNRLGQVPDSSWFENRIGRRAYSVEEVFGGAAGDTGLAAGPLSVIGGKIDGVSAGFVVRDAANQVWYLKLDHPAFPELSTSAELITSRLLWLAGYRVPAMQAFDVDVSRFVLDPKARTKDRYNRSTPLTAAFLAQLLYNTNPDHNGRIRALISRQPPGQVLGPFSYEGQRADDPNDTIPHEHRRSLRALWLFSAWVNNIDTRDANTLDMFRATEPDGRGIIEHYLIDFGDSFGSTGLGEKAAVEGWEYLVDWPTVFSNLLTLGIPYPVYERATRSSIREVGMFESRRFDPEDWRPSLPNPAFSMRGPDDLFWAASILARIQPDHIRAAVAAGHYKEDGAAAYVVETLLARRAKLLQYAFLNYLEVDRPRGDGLKLRLDDLRFLGGLPPGGDIDYVVRWNLTGRRDLALLRGSVASGAPELVIDLAPAIAARRADLALEPFITVELSRHGGAKLDVHLRVEGGRLVPIAADR